MQLHVTVARGPKQLEDIANTPQRAEHRHESAVASRGVCVGTTRIARCLKSNAEEYSQGEEKIFPGVIPFSTDMWIVRVRCRVSIDLGQSCERKGLLTTMVNVSALLSATRNLSTGYGTSRALLERELDDSWAKSIATVSNSHSRVMNS